MTDPSPDRVNVGLLGELFAIVKGECPSLLNEDSGGYGALAIQIEQALSAAPRPIGEGFGSSSEGADTHRDADGAVVGWKAQVVERLKALWLT